MAFSLPGAIAGFSTRLDDILTTRNTRIAAREDQEATLATKLRYQKQANRDTKNAITEELAGSLGLYFKPNEVEFIMKNGVGAAKEALMLGQSAAKKGMSAGTLLNMPSAAGSLTPDAITNATEIVNNVENPETPKITNSTLNLETTGEGGDPQSLFNLEVYGDIMAPADKEQNSLDKAYDAAITKSISGSSQVIRDKNTALANSYLEQIKIKAAALADEGEESSPYSKQTIVSIQKKEINEALKENDFTVDAEGKLLQKIGNRLPEYHTAMISAYSSMKTINTGVDGQPMNPQFNADIVNKTKSSIKKIQLDARSLVNNPEAPRASKRVLNKPEQQVVATDSFTASEVLQKNANNAMYTIGDIVFMKEIDSNGISVTKIQVYTGIALNAKHNNFIYVGKM